MLHQDSGYLLTILIPDICSTDFGSTQNYSFVSMEYLKGSSSLHSVPAFRGCSKSPDMPDPQFLAVLQQHCMPQKGQHGLYLRWAFGRTRP
jgi:hypothetical protein